MHGRFCFRCIVAWAEDALSFVRDLDRAGFLASKLHQSAVIRCLEVMGEAAGRVSPVFREAHPGIPWRLMADMRNRLIHGYAAVDLDLVWDTVRNELPPLAATLRAIVPPEHPEGAEPA